MSLFYIENNRITDNYLRKSHKPLHQIFRDAEHRVSRGWTKGEYVNGYGDVCLSGALALAYGTIQPGLMLISDSVLFTIHDQLYNQSRQYRRIYRRNLGYRNNRRAAIMASIPKWNDAFRRSQKDVVKALSSVADKLESEWHEKEHKRLENEVVRLETEIRLLKDRIAELEQENSPFTIKADREQLAELEEELATTWSQLKEGIPA